MLKRPLPKLGYLALVMLAAALLARADGAPYSENGYWPTGILNPTCPNQYEYTLEPGHFFLMCWGTRN